MNMEHFSRIAFWIFILSSCLQAKPIPGIPISDWTPEYNAIMKDGCPNRPDSTFYSPKNVQDKCITTALECFKLELNTSRYECEDKSDNLPDGIEFLARLIGERTLSGYGLNATCDACETSPQLSFNGFMEAMNLLVNRHYTIKCSTP